VPRRIDYTALLYSVPRAEIAAYRRELRQNQTSRWNRAIAPDVMTVVVVVFALVMGGLVLTSFDGVLFRVSPVFTTILTVFGIGLAALALRGTFTSRNWETMLRLSRFATANSLHYTQSAGDPEYPGSIFGLGTARRVFNRLRATEGRAVEIANYRYTTGSGKDRRVHNWGYLAMRLDRRLPHMLLDARANNGMFGLSNLPTSFSKNQVLSLEGDFNKYFTLYCPKAYERDALYVFTPDLMALLIDNAAPFDVEIVDDWMLVYSAKPFASADPAVYQRLFQIVDTVGSKTLSQSHRYVDERIGEFAPNIVAPQGQRLHSGVSFGAVVAFVVSLAVWIGLKFFDLSDLFGG